MSFFKPEAYVRSVLDINPAQLRACGVENLVLDLDNTILPRDAKEIPADILNWISQVKAAGISVCLLSNEWHKSVFAYGDELGFPMVYRAMKPWPSAFIKARHLAGGVRNNSLHVGDQTVTDVWGAHLSGMSVILVQPQSTSDLPHTLALRKLEKPFLRNQVPACTLGEISLRGRKK